ncbi:mitofilin family membrane protein [Jannaschia formosa]|uniref:mitofilin family membrane protein n=1 Tax=Jannaschia formosa TaxID=2259592 RepID=UPI000E1BC546|nr:mitofilin family membrane protein [Jannaschia formosa]TFL16586.1 hypothetical protein DR046_19040 [Jannaschia formosa]
MARKTRKPRPTTPSDASETGPQDIADADAAREDRIEEAEIVAESDDTIPGSPPPEDAILADPAGEAPAPRETADETPPAAPEDAPLVEEAMDREVTAEQVDPADAPEPEDMTAESGGASDGLAPTEVPPVNARPLGDDTVPPATEEDVADLARLDGADPEEMKTEASQDERRAGETRHPAPPEERPAPPPAAAAQPQVIEKRGPGFVPLLLGGLLAGAIGYAIPTYLVPPAETVDPAALAALEARIDALPVGEATDLSAIEAAQAEMSERLDALASQVGALEAAPAAVAPSEGTAPSGNGEALAALRADVDALSGQVEPLSSLQGDLDALSGRIDSLSGLQGDLDALSGQVDALSGLQGDLGALSDRVDELAATVEDLPPPAPDLTDRVAALESELAALNEETEAVEASAEELAREAAANQIRIAVDSGVPYAEPLSVIGGEVPLVLYNNAETGLPTVAELTAAFPDAARDALAEARLVEPEGGGLGAFIRRQTGARSLEPREGDDADAVLSRAEAAVRAGDIDAALAELEALPPEAQAAMAGWIDAARTRAAARDALPDYLGTE